MHLAIRTPRSLLGLALGLTLFLAFSVSPAQAKSHSCGYVGPGMGIFTTATVSVPCRLARQVMAATNHRCWNADGGWTGCKLSAFSCTYRRLRPGRYDIGAGHWDRIIWGATLLRCATSNGKQRVQGVEGE